MKLSEHQQKFTRDLAQLINYAIAHEYLPVVTEVYRTKKTQEEYYFKGKSKTLKSQHLKCLAADIYFYLNGKCLLKLKKEDIGKVENLGLYWQGLSKYNRAGMFYKSFFDFPHFERLLKPRK